MSHTHKLTEKHCIFKLTNRGSIAKFTTKIAYLTNYFKSQTN